MDALSVDTLELEKDVQDNWEKEIRRLEQFSKNVQNLHVKCLYCLDQCVVKVAKEAWTIIVKKIGASFGHWRELGIFLGLSSDDLDYIQYSVNADKTDTVLRVYMQNDNATLDNVTNALVKMKRYDVLKAIEEPLLQLSQSLKRRQNSDTGYASLSENIIIPLNIQNKLPEVLQSTNALSGQRDNSSKNKSKPVHVPSSLDESKVIIFLTFVEDGKETAEKFPKLIQRWQDDSIQVEIVSLNRRRIEVMTNPEIIIQSYLRKADLIVPIVTEGYMTEISSHKQKLIETNLDYMYARFIFTQLNHSFSLMDSCFNKNVRCLIPNNEDSNITMKIRNHQVLVPWVWEADFDVTFKDLVKNAMNNKENL